jgi:SAM-dependent methyltransferase
MSPATMGQEAIWHDVECGAYAGDLPLWDALAREAAGPVLELGAGTGRVCLRLAAAGHDVVAVDRSPALIAELRRRAEERGIELGCEVADARELHLGRRFAAVLAPMQFAHLLGGESGRGAALRAVTAHLAPGGVLAAALLGPDAVGASAATPVAPLPDVREIDGWVYSSLPLEVRDAGAAIEVRRLRQLVSPAGELTESVDLTRLDHVDADLLEAEASAAGLAQRERLEIAPTADHVGSIVCVLEAPA